MLEKPDLSDEKIVACLLETYGLRVVQVEFLPLGADLNTAVYRVITDDDTPYFLKLRSGVFDEASVTFPHLLQLQGIEQVIAPLPTKAGYLWGNLDTMKVILFPFIEGQNGYEIKLSTAHWHTFGVTLKQMHTMDVSPTVTRNIQQETYDPRWRNIVTTSLARIKDTTFPDAGAAKLAAALDAKQDIILDLVPVRLKDLLKH